MQMLGAVHAARLPAARMRRVAEGQPTRTLNEADSLALSARHGVPVVAHRLCRSPDEAVAALQELGAPVVVKGCSSDVPHKSEWGLVKLDVRSEEQVRALYDDFDRTAAPGRRALRRRDRRRAWCAAGASS